MGGTIVTHVYTCNSPGGYRMLFRKSLGLAHIALPSYACRGGIGPPQQVGAPASTPLRRRWAEHGLSRHSGRLRAMGTFVPVALAPLEADRPLPMFIGVGLVGQLGVYD